MRREPLAGLQLAYTGYYAARRPEPTVRERAPRREPEGEDPTARARCRLLMTPGENARGPRPVVRSDRPRVIWLETADDLDATT